MDAVDPSTRSLKLRVRGRPFCEGKGEAKGITGEPAAASAQRTNWLPPEVVRALPPASSSLSSVSSILQRVGDYAGTGVAQGASAALHAQGAKHWLVWQDRLQSRVI